MRALTTVSALALAAGAWAAEPTETITVSASATVMVKPDTARVHYAVRASEPSVAEAKESATKLATAVADAGKGLKLANLTTATGALTYSRATGRLRQGFGGPGGNPPPAPQATYSAQVALASTIQEKDADKLVGSVDALVKKVIESGAVMVGDGIDPDGPFGTAASRLSSADAPRIEWSLSDDTAARRDAFRAAVRKAKANGEAIAKELGWESAKVVSVVDGVSGPGETTYPDRRATAPGEVAVTARVTLKFSR